MGYRHIENLYKNKVILMFKQAYAMEKVHGTSAHVQYKASEDRLIFFSGGCTHERFVELFDQNALLEKFRENAKSYPKNDIIFFGEAAGGKLQGMSKTYGSNLFFIVFEVKINNIWLSVREAEKMALNFGFEFVPYKTIDTTEEAINAEMMADSEVAIRKGMGSGHMREGIVLRPLIEFVCQYEDNNGGPIRVKHKRPEFAEREHTPKFSSPEELKILEDAKEIANEWVVPMRLEHVLNKLISNNILSDKLDMKDVNKVIKGMLEDVLREAEGEIVDNKAVRKAISAKTVKLFINKIASYGV